MIIRFIRRRRAARIHEAASARVLELQPRLRAAIRLHRPRQHIINELLAARNDQLRAENVLRGV